MHKQFSLTQTQRSAPNSGQQSRPSSFSSSLSWLLVPTLLVMNCAIASAQGSRPQASNQKATAADKTNAELARALDACQVQLDHARRLLLLDTEQGKLDAEAIQLRDQKIALLESQLADARHALDELKLAGASDAATIKALKEEVTLLSKEVRTLKISNWLTGRLSIGMIVAALVVGFVLGGKQ